MKRGTSHSPAARAKISAASKAAVADPAVRAKMSAAMKAAWADPAVRAKMSAARKTLPPMTAEQRRIYVKLRACGCSRDQALGEALKPRKKAA